MPQVKDVYLAWINSEIERVEDQIIRGVVLECVADSEREALVSARRMYCIVNGIEVPIEHQ